MGGNEQYNAVPANPLIVFLVPPNSRNKQGWGRIEMPIPKNWVEELAVEWLTLEGYMTESNVRLKATRRGGVPEADVVGAKLAVEQLQIKHIETGSLSGGLQNNLETVKAKFGEDRKDAVTSIVREKIAWEDDIGYDCIYIASYAGKPDELRISLTAEGISFWLLDEFIEAEVFRVIDDWKRTQVKSGRRRTSDTRHMTLPEPYWLLNLLDFLRQQGILSLDL